MHWIETAGWLGTIFTASAFSMRDLIALRAVSVAANLAFLSYGAASSLWPVLALHAFLLPVNLLRLYELFRLRRRAPVGGLG